MVECVSAACSWTTVFVILRADESQLHPRYTVHCATCALKSAAFNVQHLCFDCMHSVFEPPPDAEGPFALVEVEVEVQRMDAASSNTSTSSTATLEVK